MISIGIMELVASELDTCNKNGKLSTLLSPIL